LLSAGAPSQTPPEELTVLPRPLAVFKGLLLREGKEKEGEGKVNGGK